MLSPMQGRGVAVREQNAPQCAPWGGPHPSSGNNLRVGRRRGFNAVGIWPAHRHSRGEPYICDGLLRLLLRIPCVPAGVFHLALELRQVGLQLLLGVDEAGVLGQEKRCSRACVGPGLAPHPHPTCPPLTWVCSSCTLSLASRSSCSASFRALSVCSRDARSSSTSACSRLALRSTMASCSFRSSWPRRASSRWSWVS